MKDNQLNKKPEYYRNLSGLPTTTKLKGGGIVGQTVIPILSIIKETIKYDGVDDIEVSIRHGLNNLYELVGRFSNQVGIWCMLSNQDFGDAIISSDSNVLFKELRKNDLDLFVHFGTDKSDIKIELYFLKFSL